MPDIEKVEEAQEENLIDPLPEAVEQEVDQEEDSSVDDAEVQEETPEVDPAEKLDKVLSQKAELAEVEAKMLAQKAIIQTEEDALHHTLASSQVKTLFELLDSLAEMREARELHEQIGACLQGIQHHDSD